MDLSETCFPFVFTTHVLTSNVSNVTDRAISLGALLEPGLEHGCCTYTTASSTTEVQRQGVVLIEIVIDKVIFHTTCPTCASWRRATGPGVIENSSITISGIPVTTAIGAFRLDASCSGSFSPNEHQDGLKSAYLNMAPQAETYGSNCSLYAK